MTYGIAGSLETITNALGEVTTLKYDLAGRVISQRLPDNRLIKFSYDPNGNVTGITPPWKSTHEINYNGFNLIDNYLPPTIEAPNTNTSYVYSNDRELVQINRPDGQVIEFNHNTTTGSLDSIDLPNGMRTFSYSYGIMNYSLSEDNIAKGYVFSGTKVINDSFFNGPHSFHVSNTFNDDHNLSTETLMSGPTNWPINFGYDDDTLLTSAGDQTYLRDTHSGFLNQMNLGGVQQNFSYSPAFGELLSMNAEFGGADLYKETMTRDKLGRIKTVIEQYGSDAQRLSEYTYDKAGRLTAVAVNGEPHSSYVYDSNSNRTGQTINGSTLTAAFSPISISIGDEHSCSLTSSGVKCWGEASSGALGYRNLKDIGDNELLTAVNFVRLGTTIKSISSGNRHNCVQFINNNIRCWGENTHGQLGLGHTLNIGDDEQPSSQPYLNFGGKALILASGGSHSCILKPQNKVSCWGLGSSGQLGYGNTNNVGDDEHPVTAGDVPTGSNSRIVQLVAGDSHTCLMATNGRFKCWGSNSHRQLGFGTTGTNVGDDELPDANPYLNIGELIKQISAGGDHTCVVTEANKLKCWGRNDYGQLGLGNTTVLTTTPRLHPYVDVGEDVKSVSAGRNSTCVTTVTDKVKCWGLNDAGQLGQGNLATIGEDEHPSAIPFLDFGPSPVVAVKISDKHACAMLADKNVTCWGSGASGRLGIGNINNIGDNESPNSVGFIQGLKQDGIKYDDQDRLLAFGTKSFTYNSNGDLMSEVDSATGITRTFEYDVFGNLKKVILPNKTISYRVDAHNRRVSKYVDSVLVQHYIWNSENQLIGLADGSGLVTTRFVYGSKSHSPDYMIKDNVQYQIVSNHLGSPVSVVNTSSGEVAQKISYDEFGNILSDSQLGFTPIGFVGCLFDVDTKLCRFGARDYDSSIGRWLSKDPILFAGGDTNLYGYVIQDPVNFIDPNGEAFAILIPFLPYLPGLVTAAKVAGAMAAAYAINKLSDWQWKKLKENTGEHPEEIKERLVGSDGGKWDLHIEKDGRITIRPKNGKAGPIDTDYTKDNLKRNSCGN